MSNSIRLAVIPGDGIGPEVVAEGLKVLDATLAPYDVKVDTTEYDLGARRWYATGETLPDSVL
jgi:3-isopropylmalate dehydrogenase